MANILDKIFADKKEELETTRRRLPFAEVKSRARDMAGARDPVSALTSGKGTRIISEIKPRSPFKGALREDLDIGKIARAYAENGAAAISVLTESRYFGGSIENLETVRRATDGKTLPLLRKDFIFSDYQVYEARAFGADFFLLIATWLDKNQMADLLCLGREELGMQALVETHHEQDMEKALFAGATIIGVNNRDLGTGKTDLGIARRLIPQVRTAEGDRKVLVCESGIAGRREIEEFEQLGAQAFLVGETLMRAGDIGGKLKDLLGHGGG